VLAPGALRQLAEDRRRGVREHGDHLWLLVWHRIFIDGEESGLGDAGGVR